MPIGRVYASGNKTVVFLCPFCGTNREEAIEHYKDQHDKITVPCSCGNIFTVQIEYRNFYRKKTYLQGVYKKLAPPNPTGKLSITNLSMGGCRFDASMSHHLQPNDHIGISFSLNDAQETMIRKEAVIRQVDGRYVGCQFVTLPGAYEPALGFYLKSP
jgi:hypothetical protein